MKCAAISFGCLHVCVLFVCVYVHECDGFSKPRLDESFDGIVSASFVGGFNFIINRCANMMMHFFCLCLRCCPCGSSTVMLSLLGLPRCCEVEYPISLH